LEEFSVTYSYVSEKAFWNKILFHRSPSFLILLCSGAATTVVMMKAG